MAWIQVDEEQDDGLQGDAMSESYTPGTEVSSGPPDNEVQSEVDDSEDDIAPVQPHGPQSATEKRRAQIELMRAFVADISANMTEREINDAASKSAAEDQMSIRDILAKQETNVRITNPRDYQTELFQRAKGENIIAVLDTGSGKTHIATLLLRHILDKELEDRAQRGVHKVAFFLVESVNLVFQQANVLRCGLDQNVDGVCGAMGTSLWYKETWEKHFEKNMVLVCTAEVLVQCLMHSFISMARINLLIFDEAHHAKNNHPYARVMKDYYEQEADMSKRPRIFGMTASPVDVRGLSEQHLKKAAGDLERLLHATIATTMDSSLTASSISRPHEEVAVYDRLENEFESPLHQELKARYEDVVAFQKFFIASQRHGCELGRWASDMYWSFAFTEEQSRKLQQREEAKYNKGKTGDSQREWDAKVKRLGQAAEFVRQHRFDLCTTNSNDISSKVNKLHYWLQKYYERSDDARCIVFVEQRQTARLLHLIFRDIGGPNLRSDVLVGINNRVSDHNISLKTQIQTVAKFRRGELNCLFATSVAEEGLDIPQCNLVVRFDLYRTMIGYVQSRGRARHRNSKYLHMLEAGNNDHHDRIMSVRSDELVMRNFCKDLSHERKIQDFDKDGSELLAFEDRLFPSYTVPETGAKLTYRSSLAVLNHFVATCPAPDRQTMLQPTYVVSPELNYDPQDPSRRGFVCEVILPEYSPIITMTGEVQAKKAIAKCSAAFKMCLELRKRGYLDVHLLPTTQKALPAMRNALLAVSEKKKGMYSMLIKPQFWKYGRDTIPSRLYLTIVDVDAGLDRAHQPLGLLTRQAFPQVPNFPVFLTDGNPSNVISHPCTRAFSVSAQTVELITTFTLRMFEDIYNKVYKPEIEKMSYWVVPILTDCKPKLHNICSLEDVLDMDQLHVVVTKPSWSWTVNTRPEELLDRYFVDPFNGGRRYYSNRLAKHLKPQDPVPSHIPRQSHRFMSSILDYTDSKWQKSRDISRWNRSQPVLEVEKIAFRRNHLARVEDKEQKDLEDLKTYICPEPLRISNLATPFVVMCYVLPAIIHRLESYLIALEACQVIDLEVSPALALEALTKDSDNTEEYGEEAVNFKSGMGPNYERLEFLGDCFLKMATSISTFVQQPDENEYEAHVRRMVMLCNQNLMDTAVGKKKVLREDGSESDLQLTNYIRTESFSRRTWYPEGLKLLRGKGANKSEDDWLKLTHNLGDKSIADVCEAFIGAAFSHHHKAGKWTPSYWDEAVKAVKLFANSEDHCMSRWSDYYSAYVKPKYQTASATAAMIDMAQQLAKVHPYHFKYPRLARSAFTHPSYAYMFEQIPNYQRLEFLGDALLDMAFIMHLYYQYPDKDPHWLTEHKTPMVSNKFLAAVCVKLGWHRHLKHNYMFDAQIRSYVYEIEEAEREAAGAVDYWCHVDAEPPKCLADVIEAYVAAIFVDAEFDFNVVLHFFDRHLKRYFVDMTLEAYENFSSGHPRSRLAKMVTVNFGCSDWRLGVLETQTVIPGKAKAIAAMVVIHGKVHFHALGVNGKSARAAACLAALEKLDGIPPYEFRKQYGCDCVDENEGMLTSVKEEHMKEALGPNM
ncbi:Dicer-like protein 1 [Coniothyrium glycines]